MSTRTNICKSIIYLLFFMRITEPMHLFRITRRMLGRQIKCCTLNNGNQSNVTQKLNEQPTEFRRDMTELYLGNLQGTALLSETDVLTKKMDVNQPALIDIPPIPFEEVEEHHIVTPEEQKALSCAKLPCQKEDHDDLVCACNYKSGRVVSFKNECDLRRHNCRFATDFHVILNDVCPWQYESRHDSTAFDYSNPSYYN